MNVPESFRYTSDHEWVSIEGDIATVGVTDHAQEELTDVVFVELPDAGRAVSKGEAIAVVESVKAASDIFSPVTGEVTEGNAAAEGEPALVNTDPHGTGWIFKVRMSDPSELDGMMNAAAYRELIS
ncbi:MAG: glycine cleavage system protein GcvH [Akkermansiaceae bacterium]|nr:glycine cleavage system protein GcvH [Akkermansiaceae bacterium]|tara:strand:+ start:168 stop:545 length:378 start_codon:yes stop_codon:yes gene_type:complete